MICPLYSAGNLRVREAESKTLCVGISPPVKCERKTRLCACTCVCVCARMDRCVHRCFPPLRDRFQKHLYVFPLLVSSFSKMRSSSNFLLGKAEVFQGWRRKFAVEDPHST